MTEERLNSVLTDSQRNFLRRGEDDGSSRARMTKSRIRERYKAALKDLALLVERLPDDEIPKVFRDDDSRPSEQWALAAVLYLTQYEDTKTAGEILTGDIDETRDRRAQAMEDVVSHGIERAIYTREGVSVNSVETSITVDRGDDLSQLAQGDLSRLSRNTLDQLYRADEITAEEYADANAERFERIAGGGSPPDE